MFFIPDRPIIRDSYSCAKQAFLTIILQFIVANTNRQLDKIYMISHRVLLLTRVTLFVQVFFHEVLLTSAIYK
jgi:hypothetical protein